MLKLSSQIFDILPFPKVNYYPHVQISNILKIFNQMQEKSGHAAPNKWKKLLVQTYKYSTNNQKG